MASGSTVRPSRRSADTAGVAATNIPDSTKAKRDRTTSPIPDRGSVEPARCNVKCARAIAPRMPWRRYRDVTPSCDSLREIFRDRLERAPECAVLDLIDDALLICRSDLELRPPIDEAAIAFGYRQ